MNEERHISDLLPDGAIPAFSIGFDERAASIIEAIDKRLANSTREELSNFRACLINSVQAMLKEFDKLVKNCDIDMQIDSRKFFMPLLLEVCHKHAGFNSACCDLATMKHEAENAYKELFNALLKKHGNKFIEQSIQARNTEKWVEQL